MRDRNVPSDGDSTGFQAGIEAVQPQKDTFFTIGVFDGVHIGHQSLISHMTTIATENGCQSGVITFHPNPIEVLRPGTSIKYLTDIKERVRLIRSLGVEIVVPVVFTVELSKIRARDFVVLLKEKLRLKGLVIGADFAMGHDREGTPEFLTNLGRELGFLVDVVAHKDVGGARVSSTAVRAAIAKGDLATANKLLGRTHTTAGIVVYGDGLGSALGFPTANMSIPSDLAIPADGIYATRVRHGGKLYSAASYVGTSPTFGGKERTVEAYLLDFEGNLYGEEIVIEWISRVREDRAFGTSAELQAQMARDVLTTKEILGV